MKKKKNLQTKLFIISKTFAVFIFGLTMYTLVLFPHEIQQNII